jgi:hypothetical protein
MKNIKKDILSFFLKCESGTIIPGRISGKGYLFIRLDKYIGRGKYSYLNEEDIIVIESENRKRNFIKLFLEPVSILYISKFDEIGYGKVPSSFVKLKYGDNGPLFPNLLEYETHYKAIARYVKENKEKT